MKRKQYIALILTAALLLLSSCGKTDKSEASTQETENFSVTISSEESTASTHTDISDNGDVKTYSEQETETPQTNTLVLYFSRVGNTDFLDDVDAVSSASLLMDGDELKGNCQIVGEWIAEVTGADIAGILTEKHYPDSYDKTTDVALEEQRNNERPVLLELPIEPENYREIFFVIPNWWNDLPMAMYGFFENYDFSGHRLVISCTHGGGGFANTIKTIEKLQPEADVIRGISINKADVPNAYNDVVEWAEQYTQE